VGLMAIRRNWRPALAAAKRNWRPALAAALLVDAMIWLAISCSRLLAQVVAVGISEDLSIGFRSWLIAVVWLAVAIACVVQLLIVFSPDGHRVRSQLAVTSRPLNLIVAFWLLVIVLDVCQLLAISDYERSMLMLQAAFTFNLRFEMKSSKTAPASQPVGS
jgi:hypothetical protein